MEADRLDDLVPYGMNGTEGGHGFLEDKTDVSPANRTHFPAVALELNEVRLRPVGAGQEDLSFDNSPGIVDDPEDRLRRNAFSAAALPDDAEGLSRPDIEGSSVDGFRRSLVLKKTSF